MDKKALDIQIEGARAYDGLFVPALFGQWADTVASALNVNPGERVLDVACGTGVLTRKLSALATSAGSVTGLDPNVGMLTVAGESDSDIIWKQGVAESLPFEENSFDAVASQFGLMFFENPSVAIAEFLRVTKPGGNIALAVWDAIEQIPGYSVEHALIQKMAGEDAAGAVAAPFCMGDKDKLQELLENAGAKDVAIETHKGVARFPNIATMVNAELRGWLPIMGVNLDEELIQRILAAAESEMSAFVGEDDKLEFDVTAHVAVFSG